MSVLLRLQLSRYTVPPNLRVSTTRTSALA